MSCSERKDVGQAVEVDVEFELRMVKTFADEAEEHSAHGAEVVHGLQDAARDLLAAWHQDPSSADPRGLLIELGAARHVITRLVGAIEGVEEHVARLPVSLGASR